MKIVILALVLSMLAISGQAQNVREKTFPIGKPFPDQFAFCMTEKDAVDIINADVEGNLDAILPDKQGKCFVEQAIIVYKRLIYRVEKDGVPYSVYEATVGARTIYVPMKTWTAEVI